MPHLNLIFLKDKPFKTWEEQKCKDGKIDLILEIKELNVELNINEIKDIKFH